MLKVTLITACYNSEKTIAETIRSANGQDYPHIEHIFIDGASKDRTVEIIRESSTRAPIILSEPDKGIYDALNKGLKMATGDIIGLLHSNDLLANPNAISKLVESFEATASDIVFGNTLCFSEHDPEKIVRRVRVGAFSKSKFETGWFPSHPTIYVKRDVMTQIGLFRTDMRIAADYEHVMRMMYLSNFKIHYMDTYVYKFRLGGVSNGSFKNIVESNKQCIQAWRLHNLKVPMLLIPLKMLRKIPQYASSFFSN
jgi:glycosyltransferase